MLPPLWLQFLLKRSNWTALGSGMGGVNEPNVFALAVSGSDVYAGGYFSMAGGAAAYSIAKWNGNNWTPLGSGIEGQVSALAISGNDLYVGGGSMAGGKESFYISRAYLSALPMLSSLRSGTDLKISWPAADTASFTLEQAGTLAASTNWIMNSAPVTNDGTNRSAIISATNIHQFFRLRRP